MRATILLVLPLMAGCARLQGEFPSLQSRPVEAVRLPDPDAPPPPRAVAAPPDAGVLAQADRTLAEAEADLAAAQAALARALAAARGQPAGSLAWTEAQVALSRLWEGCVPAAVQRDALVPATADDPPGLPPLPSPAAQARIERAEALMARCEAETERARAQLAR
ncbi:MAG: hypothetical protein ACK40H_07905 [Sphingomonadaceae bacterium]